MAQPSAPTKEESFYAPNPDSTASMTLTSPNPSAPTSPAVSGTPRQEVLGPSMPSMRDRCKPRPSIEGPLVQHAETTLTALTQQTPSSIMRCISPGAEPNISIREIATMANSSCSTCSAAIAYRKAFSAARMGTIGTTASSTSVPASALSVKLAESAARVRGRALTTDIPSHLRRGVSLDTALAGFGRLWVPSSCGGIQTEARDYDLSKEVAEYDAFISHDWWTNRYLKVLALTILFNSSAAGVVASVFVVAYSSLNMFVAWPQELPEARCQKWVIAGEERCLRSDWGFPVGLAVFFLTLCSWQRIRKLFRCAKVVFFDKICINQTDEELNIAGIMGLAGFLRHSKDIVVLWSPRYFLRLWCTFELASWMHLKEKPPIVMPVCLALCIALVSLLYAVLFCVAYAAFEADTWTYRGVVMAATMVLTFPAMVVARQVSEDLNKLPRQVDDFSIRNAESFCCANEHIVPETGKAILCDRALVFKTVAEWFGDDTEFDLERSLDIFDLDVKLRIGPAFVQTLRGATTFYKLSLSMGGALYICWSTGYSASVLELGGETAARYFLEVFQVAFLVIPVSFKCFLLVADAFTAATGQWPFILDAGTRTLAFSFLLFAMWLPLGILRGLRSPIPQLILTFALTLLTVGMFCLPRWLEMREGDR